MKSTVTVAIQKNKTTIYYKIPIEKLSNKQKNHYFTYNNINITKKNMNQ